MKLCIGASIVLSAAAAPWNHHSASLRSSSLVAEHTESQVAVYRKKEHKHFGDTVCPCIGFDNIEGETIVSLDGGKDVAYPADLGSRCEAWDDGLHPQCKTGQTPGLGAGWCAQAWCYVDACNCDIPILPKVSSYLPGASYRGKPMFYSYNTCGGEDSWTDAVPQVGIAGCRCIGFDGQQGTMEVSVGKGKKADYPAEIGGSCKAWDHNTHPSCKGDKPPSWCKAKWCFVDPCSCKLAGDIPPKISSYLPEATFTGKSIYYSYETCGEEDEWTQNNDKACVNQESKSDCTALKRCGWTGSKCLGKELIDHPLCVAPKKKKREAESGAFKNGAGLATALALFALARA